MHFHPVSLLYIEFDGRRSSTESLSSEPCNAVLISTAFVNGEVPLFQSVETEAYSPLYTGKSSSLQLW